MTPQLAVRMLSDDELFSEVQRRRSGFPWVRKVQRNCPACGVLCETARGARAHCRPQTDPETEALLALVTQAAALAAKRVLATANSRAANKLQRKRKPKAVAPAAPTSEDKANKPTP